MSSRLADAGIDFSADYKHRELDNQKQQYRDFYRDHVSAFSKNKQEQLQFQGNSNNALLFQDLRKEKLQQQMSAQPGGFASLQQQQRSDYAQVLNQQIQEKKEFELRKRMKEDQDDFMISPRQQQKNYPPNQHQYQQQQQPQQQQQLQHPQQLQQAPYQEYPQLQQVQSYPQQQQLQKQEQQQQSQQMLIGELNQMSARNGQQLDQFYKGEAENFTYGAGQSAGYPRGDMEESQQQGRYAVSGQMRQVSNMRPGGGVKSLGDVIVENSIIEKQAREKQNANLAAELNEQIEAKKRTKKLQKEQEDAIDRQYEHRIKEEVVELNKLHKAQLEKEKPHELKTLQRNGRGIVETTTSSKDKQGVRRLENLERIIKIDEKLNAPSISGESTFRGGGSQAGRMTSERKGGGVGSQKDEVINLHVVQEEGQGNVSGSRSDNNILLNDSALNDLYANVRNESFANMRARLDYETSATLMEAQRFRKDAMIALEAKNQALIDLENVKDQMKRKGVVDGLKMKEFTWSLMEEPNIIDNPLNTNINGKGSEWNIDISAAKDKQQQLYQSQYLDARDNRGREFKQMGNRRYEMKDNDILDKLISQSSNLLVNQGKSTRNPRTLDEKLEKRLANINLNRAEMQLVEVDNLLFNIRSNL